MFGNGDFNYLTKFLQYCMCVIFHYYPANGLATCNVLTEGLSDVNYWLLRSMLNRLNERGTCSVVLLEVTDFLAMSMLCLTGGVLGARDTQFLQLIFGCGTSKIGNVGYKRRFVADQRRATRRCDVPINGVRTNKKENIGSL